MHSRTSPQHHNSALYASDCNYPFVLDTVHNEAYTNTSSPLRGCHGPPLRRACLLQAFEAHGLVERTAQFTRRLSSEGDYDYVSSGVARSEWLSRVVSDRRTNHSWMLHKSQYRVLNHGFSNVLHRRVPFEVHGPSWNLLVSGAKHWILSEARDKDLDDSSCERRCADKTATLQRADAKKTRFMQRAGQLVWVPGGWWHSTCQCTVVQESLFALVKS